MRDPHDEESYLNAALRHGEEAAFLPWQSAAPDEELMRKEDGPEDCPRRGWLLEELMAYLFGDKEPERWENVAMRALAVFWHCLPGLLVGRDMGELDRVKKTAVIRRGFNLEEFVRLSADEEWRNMLKELMNFLYPGKHGWMKKGTMRAYLMARAYQPELVMIEKAVAGEKRRRMDLNYEDMAAIFEGDELETDEARDRARSRWSARAQVLLRKPVEEAGGVAHIRFGKSATARAGYAASAKRTCNRRKGG